jgi:hypothetical protein
MIAPDLTDTMRLSQSVLSFGLAALLATACARKSVVREDHRGDFAPHSGTGMIEVTRLDSAIDLYAAAPGRARDAEVKTALARLAAEIVSLANDLGHRTVAERAESEEELADLRRYLRRAQVRFAKLQTEIAHRQATYAVSLGGEKLEIAAQKTDRDFKEVASAGRDSDR